MKQCIIALVCLLAFSCSSTYQISTLNHDPKVTVIDNEFQLDRLLRKDFKFRWNFAQYAMSQPYGWYMSNYSFNRWRPYSTFDIYWNRYQFWNDWAFNYPYNYGWNSWNSWSWHNPYRPWWYRSYNPWNNWYNGPFNNPGYNVAWNSSRENNNIAYINGPRSTRGGVNIEEDGNNMAYLSLLNGGLIFYITAIVLAYFWIIQFTFLMMIEDDIFPSKYDKILWVIAFVFAFPVAPFAFLLFKRTKELSKRE